MEFATTRHPRLRNAAARKKCVSADRSTRGVDQRMGDSLARTADPNPTDKNKLLSMIGKQMLEDWLSLKGRRKANCVPSDASPDSRDSHRKTATSPKVVRENRHLQYKIRRFVRSQDRVEKHAQQARKVGPYHNPFRWLEREWLASTSCRAKP